MKSIINRKFFSPLSSESLSTMRETPRGRGEIVERNVLDHNSSANLLSTTTKTCCRARVVWDVLFSKVSLLFFFLSFFFFFFSFFFFSSFSKGGGWVEGDGQKGSFSLSEFGTA